LLQVPFLGPWLWQGEGSSGVSEERWVEKGLSGKASGYIHTCSGLKGVARELRNCGTVVSEAEELDAVLAGLHPRHNMLRTVLENDSTATLASALLMKDEQKVPLSIREGRQL